MADEKKPAPETFGEASLEGLHQERDATDKAFEVLKKVGASTADGTASRVAGTAVAQSNRELSAAIIVAAEMIDSSIKTFTTDSTETANTLSKWTRRLVYVCEPSGP